MSYCLNPGCRSPQNPDMALYCQTCGSGLLLSGQYRPLSVIGQGGFGRTFLAVNESVPGKPTCVIKQFHFSAENPETYRKAAQLFRQEVMRLQVLGRHPQIPQLLGYIEENQQLYCIQELIPGPTLSKALIQQGVFREGQIWQLLTDLLPVLQFIHDHQVVHRDIKPANIIHRITASTTSQPKAGMTVAQSQQQLEAETVIHAQSSKSSVPGSQKIGEYVLIDFGIAKVLTNTALVRTGTIIGSPEFMAPEQNRGKALPASDLYSLGVTCIHLLTATSPWDLYDVETDQWVWRNYLGQNSVSSRLGKILDQLIAPQLNQRYSSAATVLTALQEVPTPAPAIPPTVISAPVTRKPSQKSTAKSGQPENLLEKIKQVFQGKKLEDDLSSAVGIDYSKLQQLLANHQWQAADLETWQVLCQALGKTRQEYLFMTELTKIPCEDLQTIDRLWVKYSENQFGFSVQKRIYENVNEDYGKFCEQVGWLTYNPHNRLQGFQYKQSVPVGHLPSRIWAGGRKWWNHAQVMSQKLRDCGI